MSENAHVKALGDLALEVVEDRGETTVFVEPGRILDAARLLKERGFNRLSAVTCVDWLPREPRFDVVYHFHLLPLKGGRQERLRVKCRVGGEAPEIDSVTPVYEAAGWYEREVFDLFGIVFNGHADLRRILMPDDWQGHPLRKDYPVHGYKYSYAHGKE